MDNFSIIKGDQGNALALAHCNRHMVRDAWFSVPRGDQKLRDAVRSEDYVHIQAVYEKNHNTLPCYLLDIATSVKMIQFLEGLKASCWCSRPNRSRLARRILGEKIYPAPIKRRGTALDLAVAQGDFEAVNTLCDAGARADLSQNHWKDFVIRNYFMEARSKKRALVLVRWAFLPTVIAFIVCSFCDDWDDIKAVLEHV